ncbi:Uncharacterised protein [Mycolicibacterium vanbaalenii]|uniref:Transmembrane protein n=1 Tax=Mycolicibacterium vanbaalenii TaxID=110539 RepID=A0A5S9QX59_MYCVN|nr:hypothetical protein [Mycolicibacterium vanbaalenii]CAA0124425.1 Uncharacterised protein [Mycolicibacterium vanbaalenii]
MNSRSDHVQWWQRQDTSFWVAATLGVPILLSAALLLLLMMKMAFDGGGTVLLSSTVIPVVIVELVLVLGSVWLARRSSSWTTGAAVAGAIAGICTLVAAAVTI